MKPPKRLSRADECRPTTTHAGQRAKKIEDAAIVLAEELCKTFGYAPNEAEKLAQHAITCIAAGIIPGFDLVEDSDPRKTISDLIDVYTSKLTPITPR